MATLYHYLVLVLSSVHTVSSITTANLRDIHESRLRACYPEHSHLLIRYRRAAFPLSLQKSHSSPGDNLMRLRRSGPNINQTMQDIRQGAMYIKQLAKDLRKFYIGQRLTEEDRHQHVDLITITTRSQQLTQTEVVYTSAKLVSDLVRWMNDMIVYEQTHEKLLEHTVVRDLVRMQQDLRHLECLLLTLFLRMQLEEDQANHRQNTNLEKVGAILATLRNRRAHFWRDLMVLKETEELMKFIATTIKPFPLPA